MTNTLLIVMFALPSLILTFVTPSIAELAPGEQKQIVVKTAYLTPRRIAEVAAAEEGPITTLKVVEGTLVKARGIVAQLEEVDARNALQRSELQLQMSEKLAKSRTALTFANSLQQHAISELRRAEELRRLNAGAVSETEISTLNLDVAKATQEVEKSQETLELAELSRRVAVVERDTAQAALQKRQILAPFDGAVTRLYKSEGEWVRPGDPVFRIVQLDQLVARANIDIRHFSNEFKAAEAWLTVLDETGDDKSSRKLQGRRFSGKVIFIDPEIDAVNGQFEIRAQFENPNLELTPGLRVQLTITFNPENEARIDRGPQR